MSDSRSNPVSPAIFRAERELLVSDPRVGGGELRRALTATTDAWLVGVYDQALGATGSSSDGIALVALGGYGRGELFPGSDLDLAVVHRRNPKRAAAIAEAVWYPVWDTGVHLGHGVRSITEAVAVVGSDFESSTALLDARVVAGDPSVVDELSTRVTAAWKDALGAAVDWLHADADARRRRFGDVAFSVEPNIKAGGGGLRDARIPTWLGVGADLVGPDDLAALAEADAWLADVRVALHRSRSSSGEVLRLEDQDAVAAALGVGDADELMTRIAGAARRIDWVLDEVWVQATGLAGADAARPRRRRRNRGNDDVDHTDAPTGTTGTTGTTVDGDVDIDVTDPAEVLGRVADAARAGRRPGRPFLARLAAEMPSPSIPWDEPTRRGFVELLSAGPGMIRIVEALDQVGVWERFLPEWSGVRTRAQRTTHHRYTVDRHLLEAVSIASTLTDRVARGDLLVVAALLHDLGKGHGGDHSTIGVDMALRIGPRMGFDRDDVAVLATLVRLHLLLPEVATRRDIADRATIESVADAVGSVEVLGLLLALTEADARATGPTAWTDWKAGLVRTLAERTGAALTGTIDEPLGPTFPSVDQLALLQAHRTTVVGSGRTLTVVAPDRPRLFCRVTGALVLSGLNVVSAAVTSSDGMALEEFTVAPAFAQGELADAVPIDWAKVCAEVERCMAGRVALAARVAERADVYRRRRRSADAGVRVRFDDSMPDECVVEVDAPDGVGLLFRITTALADLDIDIRYARVETQTDRVVDAFSITASDGSSVIDEADRAEIERAIRYAVTG